MHVLVTGASGFLGRRMTARLGERHQATCISRHLPETRDSEGGSIRFLPIAFDREDDLRLLDGEAFDAVLHLAAVTGGSDEESAIAVNVAGTRRLYRYLLDRGCRKFVTASSIAAAGALDSRFVPEELPIPDDHPCLATDAYGLSKALVEQLTSYFHRQVPDADFVNVRLGAVMDDAKDVQPAIGVNTKLTAPYVELGRVYASDVEEAFLRILEAPPKRRVFTCNLVGPDAGASVPTVDMLRAWHGAEAERYRLDSYAESGDAYGPVYAMERLKTEFAFVPAKRIAPFRANRNDEGSE